MDKVKQYTPCYKITSRFTVMQWWKDYCISIHFHKLQIIF